MGRPADFPGSNFTFTGGDRDDVVDLPCFNNKKAVAICVELEPGEIEEVVRTGKVWMTVLSGGSFYPTFIGSEDNCRDVMLATGPVWRKENGPLDRSQP